MCFLLGPSFGDAKIVPRRGGFLFSFENVFAAMVKM